MLLMLSACGGGGSSTPTSPPPVTPPPTPTNTWSITGTLLDTIGRQTIGGATVTPSWGLAAVTTNSGGQYSLGATTNPPTNPYKLTLSAEGYLTREQWITWQSGARTGITLDLIRNAAPFSMDYYKQLVRGTYDRTDGPWPVLRWTEPPSFYLKTVDQNGRAIEPEVLLVVREALGRAVPAYTGNLYSARTIETGVDTRDQLPGWINVTIVRDPSQRNLCGSAFIGRNPGEITLYNDVCSCGSVKIPGATVMHEVGHALGFFHVGDNRSVMFPFIPGNCPPGDLSATERFHAGLAYQRPRGNADPDNDPPSGQLLSPGDFPGPTIRVRN